MFDKDADTMPVFGSIASQFNDPGTNTLYRALLDAPGFVEVDTRHLKMANAGGMAVQRVVAERPALPATQDRGPVRHPLQPPAAG